MTPIRPIKMLTKIFGALLAMAVLFSTVTQAHAFSVGTAKYPDPDRPPAAEPTVVLAYDASGAMHAAVVYSHEVQTLAIPVTGAKPALVYDAAGAMRAAVVYAHEVQPKVGVKLFYDATRAMEDAVMYSHEIKTFPSAISD